MTKKTKEQEDTLEELKNCLRSAGRFIAGCLRFLAKCLSDVSGGDDAVRK